MLRSFALIPESALVMSKGTDTRVRVRVRAMVSALFYGAFFVKNRVPRCGPSSPRCGPSAFSRPPARRPAPWRPGRPPAQFVAGPIETLACSRPPRTTRAATMPKAASNGVH